MRVCAFFLCMIFILSIAGCAYWGNEPTPTLPAGLLCAVDALPALEQFSATEYENYSTHFAPVLDAVYYHDGIQESVSATDPRLIRLLNFLAYSHNSGLDEWRRGLVEEDEINAYINSSFPMLEVNLDSSSPGPGEGIHTETAKLLICGGQYLLFTERSQKESILQAEQYFPYSALIWDLVMDGQLEDSMLDNGEWGEVAWIDLLTYAGF